MPYVLAMVDLEESTSMMTNIVEYKESELKNGMNWKLYLMM